jgi:VIT1/CCC1 family predicted Fe2+/Mn2+ transporter
MRRHRETHYADRIGWLRAAVLGANDGIVSISSLIVGVAAADSTPDAILVSGLAGLVAGAMSMAAGEYVSVSSQADSQNADLARERAELRDDPESEHRELARIYLGRGLDEELADQVADQLMEHDALGAHARDELGLSDVLSPNPLGAAVASGLAFAAGGVLPVVVAGVGPEALIIPAVSGGSLVFLAVLGLFSARAGGSPALKATARVTFWGAAAMAVTAVVGTVFGAVV